MLAGGLRAADLAARQSHRLEDLLLPKRGLLIRLARCVAALVLIALLLLVHRQFNPDLRRLYAAPGTSDAGRAVARGPPTVKNHTQHKPKAQLSAS